MLNLLPPVQKIIPEVSECVDKEEEERARNKKNEGETRGREEAEDKS